MTLEIDKSKNGFKYFVSDVNSSDIHELFHTWKLIADSEYGFKIWLDLMGLKLGNKIVEHAGFSLFKLKENDDKQ